MTVDLVPHLHCAYFELIGINQSWGYKSSNMKPVKQSEVDHYQNELESSIVDSVNQQNFLLKESHNFYAFI
jgi:hypothetical protein